MKSFRDNSNPTPKGMRLVFGIFMVLVYLCVGILFILDVFLIGVPWVTITVGSLLIAYGIFRGYRLYIGSN